MSADERHDVSAVWRTQSASTDRRSAVGQAVSWALQPVGVGIAIVVTILLLVNGLF